MTCERKRDGKTSHEKEKMERKKKEKLNQSYEGKKKHMWNFAWMKDYSQGRKK